MTAEVAALVKRLRAGQLVIGQDIADALEAKDAEITSLRAQLTTADDLADDLEEALGYVDDYFVEKHDMRKSLDAWRTSRTPSPEETR